MKPSQSQSTIFFISEPVAILLQGRDHHISTEQIVTILLDQTAQKGDLPKFPETKDKRKQCEQTKAAVKTLTRLYHPDINGKHGEDWAAFCEEISKIANIVYGKILEPMMFEWMSNYGDLNLYGIRYFQLLST